MRLFKFAGAQHIIADQQDQRQHHADDKAGRGLHKHGHPACGGDALPVGADHLACLDGQTVVRVVGVAAGSEGKLAVLLGDLDHAVGDDAGAVARGIEEGDHIADADRVRVCLAADDQIAALDLRIHGVRQHDHGKDPADAGYLVLIRIAADDQRDVDHQNRKEQDAQNDADGGEHRIAPAFLDGFCRRCCLFLFVHTVTVLYLISFLCMLPARSLA